MDRPQRSLAKSARWLEQTRCPYLYSGSIDRSPQWYSQFHIATLTIPGVYTFSGVLPNVQTHFLQVIDEADRLLAQSFQDWLTQVLSALSSATAPSNLYPRPDAVAPNMLSELPYPHISTFPTEDPNSSCQKLLFSATLTQDPGKIAAMQLIEPKYFVVQGSRSTEAQNSASHFITEKFSVPSTLQV